MNSKLRNKAVKLRIEEGLSYREIQKKVPVSKSTLSYWLREIPLSQERISELQQQGRRRADVKIEKFRKAMEVKRREKEGKVYRKYIKKFADLPDDTFFVAGLMLYLAEGDKKNRNRVSLANTDSAVINFFIKWITTFFEASKEDIRIQLHLYESMDIDKERSFWKNKLGVSDRQFYKEQIRELRKGSFSYAGTKSHGTCSIFIPDTAMKMEIMMAIKAFLKKFS